MVSDHPDMRVCSLCLLIMSLLCFSRISDADCLLPACVVAWLLLAGFLGGLEEFGFVGICRFTVGF